eukprot:jgi/Ulvmu1/10117/UM006_0068.1
MSPSTVNHGPMSPGRQMLVPEGPETLRATTVADDLAANTRNVASTLEGVRVVSEIPNNDGLMTLDRAFSASSFESMHSIDHGSLGVDSCIHQRASDISQEGPWTIYTRKPDPPACYQASYQPAVHPYPRPQPPDPRLELQDDHNKEQERHAATSDASPAIEQADVSREINAHHTAIRAQLETHNSAVILQLEHESKEKEYLRAKVDEQLNTVDAYLTQVDQKVDRILERVNDTAGQRSSETTGTDRQRSWRWRERTSSLLARCKAITVTQRFQIAAAGTFVVLLIAFALLLLVLLSWGPAPAFLGAIVTPLTIPSGPGTSGLVMLDVQLVIDRAAQVHYVLLPASAIHDSTSDISDPSPFDVYMTGQQSVETQLSDSAHACGTFDVPTAHENFTFTVAPAADTAECREYTRSADRSGLDEWAAAQRCSRCPALRSDTLYKLLLVAHSGGKMRLEQIDVATGDVTAPRFAQPPLVDSAETSLRLRVSSSEPAMLHWAIAYDNVAAEFRYQLLGFKSSRLSTQQVLGVSSSPVSAETSPATSTAAGATGAPRQLKQSAAGGNEILLQEAGPIVAWGQWQLGSANEVTDLEITPPCISDTVMCAEHTDSLNPQTEYKVHLVLVDVAGNAMDIPEVPMATTLPDISEPNLVLRPPCAGATSDSCQADASGRKFCGNVGSTFFDVAFTTNEGGAVYYAMTKLPARASLAELYKCEQLQIAPGEVFEVPRGERWRGCEAEPGLRRQLSASQHPLRGSRSSRRAAAASAHLHSARLGADRGTRLHAGEAGAVRELQQVAPGYGCAVTAPCACCDPQLSCKLAFEDAWAARAYLEDAGELLQSGCGYMSVSTCTELPLARQFSQFPNGTGTAPNLTALPIYAASLAANSSSTAGNASLTTSNSTMPALLADPGDDAITDSASRRALLQASGSSTIAIGPGGGTGENFTHPQFVAPGFATAGLEPDSYYALFAVSEDRTRPSPNRSGAARQWIIHSQSVGPPACEVSCSLAESTVDSMQLNVRLNTSGRVYYVLQANGTASDPTPGNVFQGVISNTEFPVLSGSVSLTFPEHADLSAPSLAFQRGLRLSQNLQQGNSYVVHAIAEDLNRPTANRMATYCTTGSPDPLVCTLVDPPCIQDLRVDCTCVDSTSAQLSVTVGKRDEGADEGYTLDYVIFDAYLPGDTVRINSTAFPLPTVAQVRAGLTPVASARLEAVGTLCVANGAESTFTMPEASGAQLQPGREYVLCAVPQEVANFTCGDGLPTCVDFTTHDDVVDVECEMSPTCDCGSAEVGCTMAVQCVAPRPTLVKYRVSPASCGALPSMFCPELFSCTEYPCCPAMADTANQNSACCPTLAEGVLCVEDGFATVAVAGVAQCGDMDVIICGTRSAAEKCGGSCGATVPCSRGGGNAAAAAAAGVSLEALEAQRQATCRTTAVAWRPDSTGAACERIEPALPPVPAPATTTFSAPMLQRKRCGSNTCAPGLCEVTVCEPGANATCTSGTPVATAYTDVHMLADSVSDVCCVRLPYDTVPPSAEDVLAGVLPAGAAGAQHECVQLSAPRMWQTVAFNPIVTSQILMAHCAARDTSGIMSDGVTSTFLSPPSVLAPACTTTMRCSGNGNSTKLALTMSVDGSVFYVLLPDRPGAAARPTLSAAQLRAEAAVPTALLPFMETPLDPSHHGSLSIATPFVRVNVPVTLRNDTTYTLLMVGEPLADSAVPCCLQRSLETVVEFPVDPGECGEVACCECASPALPELRPQISFTGGLGRPMGPPVGQEVSCDAMAFTQTFALVGGAGSGADVLEFAAGGSPLRVSQAPAAADLQLTVTPVRRAVASVRAVRQRSEFYIEDDSAVGPQQDGLRLFFRYMLFDAHSSTAVDVRGLSVRVMLRSAQQTASFACAGPAASYSADTGGDCDVIVPRSLASAGLVAIVQASVEVVAADGTKLAESTRAPVSVAGVPAQTAPLDRSGFMYAPYRPVHPGEAVRMAVFAHSAGQRAGGFQIKVQFDETVLQYAGYELHSAWKINNELPDTRTVTINADLNQATPVSGAKVPLVDVIFTLRATVTAGTYTAAAALSGVYQLKPFADAANILIAAPSHYGFEGNAAGGVPLRVVLPEDSGIIAGGWDSPLFDSASYEGGSLMATYTTQLLRTFPLGSSALSNIATNTAGYSCSSSGGSTSQLTATGCDITIPPRLLALPTSATVTTTVTYATFTESLALTILHPRITLAAEATTLRVLSPAACAPGATPPAPTSPRWQSAALFAYAQFLHPDNPTTTVAVDVSAVTPMSADNAAISVAAGRMTASAVAAAVVVSVDAARGVNPDETSVQVAALADAVCVDPLRMVMASVAAAEVVEQSSTELTVRLTVSQQFEEPGDTGVVAVYAQSAGTDGAVLSEDVTSLVRNADHLPPRTCMDWSQPSFVHHAQQMTRTHWKWWCSQLLQPALTPLLRPQAFTTSRLALQPNLFAVCTRACQH